MPSPRTGGALAHRGQSSISTSISGARARQLVALGVGQDRPGHVALADVDRGGAEVEEAGDQGCLGGG